MQLVTDTFWDYVAEATRIADDTLKIIRESELGQEVNTTITEGSAPSMEYKETLRKMTPLTDDLLNKISLEAERLKVRLEKDLSTVKAQLEPYAEELKSNVHQQVEQLRQEIVPILDSLDPDNVRVTLLQKSEELKQSMEESVKVMQSQLDPHTDQLVGKVGKNLEDFTKGCQAAPLEDDLRDKWEEGVDDFLEFVYGPKPTPAPGPDIGKELEKMMKDTMDDLNKFREDLESKLPPLAKDITDKMHEDMKLLFNKLGADMMDAKDRTTEYANELQALVQQNAEDVRYRMNLYFRKLKKRLTKDTEEINKKAATFFQELASRAEQKMDEVKDRLEPYVSDVRDRAEEKLDTINKLMKSQTEDIRDKMEKTAEDARSTLEEWFKPVTGVEGKAGGSSVNDPPLTQLSEEGNEKERVSECVVLFALFLLCPLASHVVSCCCIPAGSVPVCPPVSVLMSSCHFPNSKTCTSTFNSTLIAAAAGQGDGDTTSTGVMDKAEEVYSEITDQVFSLPITSATAISNEQKREQIKTVLEKVQQAGGAVKGFAANSYEEHLEPAVSWATEAAASAWDKVKTKLSDLFAD
ncbi:hypothetical protein JZ751_000212 [Albula glossodonta]|uniref:Uncharacterized protein n=1 Tax=Albula glossodonta TaxID=121402 RepID=A0A8T2PVQ7_9TELE|nr:hypothetical protein JZ751_000212 [Albula glossodonta]